MDTEKSHIPILEKLDNANLKDISLLYKLAINLADKSRNTGDVLTAIRTNLIEKYSLPVSGLRFYRLNRNDTLEGVGCDYTITARSKKSKDAFTAGYALEKRNSDNSPDSFLAVEKKIPVLAYVVPKTGISTLIQEEEKCVDTRLGQIRLSRDPCPLIRTPQESKLIAWIDIPLFSLKRVTGKLSCDLTLKSHGDLSDKELLSKLHKFSIMVNMAAPYLTLAADASRTSTKERLTRVREAVEKLQDLNALYKFISTKLPNLLFPKTNGRYVNATSYHSLTEIGAHGYCNQLLIKNTSSAKEAPLPESLRPHDCPSLNAFLIGPKNTTRSTYNHLVPGGTVSIDRVFAKEIGPIKTEPDQLKPDELPLLIVKFPIQPGDRTVLIVFSRRQGENYFTTADERICSDAVKKIISPRYRELEGRESEKKVFDIIDFCNQITVKEAAFSSPAKSYIFESICEFQNSIFEQQRSIVNATHRYLMVITNKFPDATSSVKPEYEIVSSVRGSGIEGELAIAENSGDLSGSLVYRALELPDPSGVVYLNDIKKATGHCIRNPPPDAVSALAAPVYFQEKPLRVGVGTLQTNENNLTNPVKFGALIILSNKSDLNPYTHGRILRLLANQMAELCYRQSTRVVEFTSGGFNHDFKHVVSRLAATINNSTLSKSEIQTRGFRIAKQLTCLVNAYAIDSSNSPIRDSDVINCKLSDLIHNAIEAARCVRNFSKGFLFQLKQSTNASIDLHEPTIATVLFNLIKNARGSKLTFSLRCRTEYIVITLIDDGPGLSEAEFSRFKNYNPLALSASELSTGIRLCQGLLSRYRRNDDVESIRGELIPRKIPQNFGCKWEIKVPIFKISNESSNS